MTALLSTDPRTGAQTETGIEATEASVRAYTELLEGLERRFADLDNATLRRKQARQAARAVLPNATETRIVVTGNYRAWRHFIAMRATEAADVEIRVMANYLTLGWAVVFSLSTARALLLERRIEMKKSHKDARAAA